MDYRLIYLKKKNNIKTLQIETLRDMVEEHVRSSLSCSLKSIKIAYYLTVYLAYLFLKSIIEYFLVLRLSLLRYRIYGKK